MMGEVRCTPRIEPGGAVCGSSGCGSEAAAIGALQGLAAVKTPGQAEMRSPGDWLMVGCGGQVEAEDLEAAPDARGQRPTVDGLPVVAADVWTEPGQYGCGMQSDEQVPVHPWCAPPCWSRSTGLRLVGVGRRPNGAGAIEGGMRELPLQPGQVGVITVSSVPDSPSG